MMKHVSEALHYLSVKHGVAMATCLASVAVPEVASVFDKSRGKEKKGRKNKLVRSFRRIRSKSPDHTKHRERSKSPGKRRKSGSTPTSAKRKSPSSPLHKPEAVGPSELPSLEVPPPTNGQAISSDHPDVSGHSLSPSENTHL